MDSEIPMNVPAPARGPTKEPLPPAEQAPAKEQVAEPDVPVDQKARRLSNEQMRILRKVPVELRAKGSNALAIDIDRLIAAIEAATESPGAAPKLNCWSCRKPYTAEQRMEADGDCPHCGVEIDLNEDDEPSTLPAADAAQEQQVGNLSAREVIAKMEAVRARPVTLEDAKLDASDGPTRIFLLAEYWKREALKARTQQILDAGWREASIAAAPPAPPMPSNEEFEAVWGRHQGHPADFAADVLETWGGWSHGMLGQVGALDVALRRAAPPAPQQATPKHLHRFITHPDGSQACEFCSAAPQQAEAQDVDTGARAEWNTKQWYEHVGAWETAEGHISFGSIMAVRAMLIQFGRCIVQPDAAEVRKQALTDTIDACEDVIRTLENDVAERAGARQCLAAIRALSDKKGGDRE